MTTLIALRSQKFFKIEHFLRFYKLGPFLDHKTESAVLMKIEDH